MSDLNKKNINYGALNRFYQNLKSHDLSGLATEQYVDDAIATVDLKPITNVSALPDAEANKDSVLRLEGDKQVYISKGNPITPTNRLPDDEQIGRACLIFDDSNSGYIYHGEFTITCADGVLHSYRWGEVERGWYPNITPVNAEHTISTTKVYQINTDEPYWSNISETGITTTYTKNVIESTNNTIGSISNNFEPATYKASESIQIGNAYMVHYGSGSAEGTYFYTSEEVQFEYNSEQLSGYKWVKIDTDTLEPISSIFIITEGTKAKDMTYYNSGSDFACTNCRVYLSNNGTISELDNEAIIRTINRNADDLEQVSNAYIYVANISGGICYYTGEIATINGVSGYKWETSNHSDFIITVGVKAEDLYTNRFRLAKGEIPVYINSTSSEIDYSRLSDGVETIQYKRSVNYQWKRVVTEDEITSLLSRIQTLENTINGINA